jgi:FKBP-type peptidyl-prolyl cis-trans isomerase (trigger factor)
MEDLKRLKQILVDYTYNNKVLLEIELNKISDKRLVIGLLVDILCKVEAYEADKEIIKSTLVLFIDETNSSKLLEYHSFFQEEMKKVTSKESISSVVKALKLLTILKDSVLDNGEVNPLEVPDFVKGVKDCSKDDIEQLKKFLLKSEMYDLIVDIEKITLEKV